MIRVRRSSSLRFRLRALRRRVQASGTRQKGNKHMSESKLATPWATEWLDSVADGSNTMSQRKLSSVEERGGGLEAVKAAAEQKGVHLLLVEDDMGNELIAASTKPFTVLC